MNDSAFLILFIAFTAMMSIIPFLLRRFKIPAVISLLVAGMIIGPTGLNLVTTLSEPLKFLGTPPPETVSHFNSLVNSLGALGLMFLMALAGMEADFKLINSAKKPVILLSILTFLIPALTGYWIYWYFKPDDLPGKLLYASLFASHSVGIVFPVIRELKLSKTRFGAAVLISTVITDVASIILLAVSVQLHRQWNSQAHMVVKGTLSIFDRMDTSLLGNSFTPVFLLIVLLYLAVAILTVSYIGKWLRKIFNPGEDMLITLLLLVILATVLIGELLGINLVVGAFIAGLGLSKVVQDQDMVVFRRFESIGYGFLIPFLFVSIGMKTDFAAFSQSGNVMIILLTVTGLIVSKMFSGFIAMRCSGFNNPAAISAGLMTVPQLSATLAAAAIGKDLGILDTQFFNTIIILAVVTTLPIPSLVRWVIEKGNVAFEDAESSPPPRVVRDEELL
ncbi:MAG: cation:proton antiporter [Lentisphaeria bacterium]|nr:cation:proton antiporter [Lentisphaeria bacterium]